MTTAYAPAVSTPAVSAPTVSVPTVSVPSICAPAVRRRSLLSVLRHRAGLLCVLTMLGSSGGYCVYALGHLAQ